MIVENLEQKITCHFVLEVLEGGDENVYQNDHIEDP